MTKNAGAPAGEEPAAVPGLPTDGEVREPVPLLDPRDGPATLVASADELGKAVDAMAKGEGPVAVDAERASGFRYGHRAFLIQLRRRGAGTMLIDPVPCPDLSGLDAALSAPAVPAVLSRLAASVMNSAAARPGGAR